MTRERDPWEIECLEEVLGTLSVPPHRAIADLTVRLEDYRPDTRLVAEWTDLVTGRRKRSELWLWRDWAGTDSVDIERVFFNNVIEG
jgi:hypothetical protein